MAINGKPAAADSQGLLALLEDITRETRLPEPPTELRLIDIDPHRAHVYWNLDAAQVDQARPLFLRVHDITQAISVDQADQTYEIEVQGLQGRWYLDFWRDDRTFVTDIGQRGSSGSFAVIARSNEIHTPPAFKSALMISGEIDPHGRAVQTELPAPVRAVEPAVEVAVEKPDAAEFLLRKFPLEAWSRDTEALSRGDEAVAVDHVSEVPSVMAAGESAVVFSDEEATTEWQSGLAFPGVEDIVGRQTENREALEAFYRASISFPPEAAQPVEPPVVPVAQEAGGDNSTYEPLPLALENLIGTSSLESAMRNLLTGLEAELHVRGRVPAGHALTLYGRTVQLNEDGTFVMIRKLIPGSWLLPLLFEHGEKE